MDSAHDNPGAHGQIDYRVAMGRMHGLLAKVTIVRGGAVFRRACALRGLGWLHAPTASPGFRPLVDAVYGLWARWRLRLTGRPILDQLCACRGACSSKS